MAYTYGQGLSNTGAAYNLWGTPASAPNPYYTQGPTYTKGLYDYSPQQAEAQQQGPSSPSIDRTGMEDMTAKQAAWWAERMGLGGLLRYGSTDGSGVPIEDRVIGGQSSAFLSPDAQRAQTFDAQRPAFLSPDAQRAQTFDAQPPAVMANSTSPYITSLLQETPYTIMPSIEELPPAPLQMTYPEVSVTGEQPYIGSPIDPSRELELGFLLEL